jgi:hypothetical protein
MLSVLEARDGQEGEESSHPNRKAPPGTMTRKGPPGRSRAGESSECPRGEGGTRDHARCRINEKPRAEARG